MIKIILFLSLAMLSCTTTPVSDDSEAVDSPITDNSAESAKKEANQVPVAADLSVPAVKVSEDNPLYANLEKAIASGNGERIKVASTELLQVNSKELKALNALAMYYYKNNKLAAAEMLLGKALAAHPKSSAVYNNWGLIELAKNEKKEALNMFHKALELDSRNYFAAANIGAIFVKEKSYQYAVFILEKFADSTVIQVDSLNHYAIALNGTGKFNEASEIYERILKKHPDHKMAMINHSILLIEKQAKYQDGLDLLSRLKFMGVEGADRELIKNLEVKAKNGISGTK